MTHAPVPVPSVVADPDGSRRAEVLTNLRGFNRRHAPDPMWEPLTIIADLPDGSLAGGLVGEFGWGWLHVDLLWVADAGRGRGLGSALLRAAEVQARGRDCVGIYLDSFDFQAPGFYLKQGFSVFGVLEDFPPGSRQTFLSKRFVPAGR
ncbi:MAG: GNAT family N-acetyltransferase [Gemmatimonadota bacterium]